MTVQNIIETLPNIVIPPKGNCLVEMEFSFESTHNHTKKHAHKLTRSLSLELSTEINGSEKSLT